MSLNRPAASTLRRAALLSLAAVAVHQLRYLFSYGAGASDALAQQGHAYLSSMLPDLAGLAVIVIVATLAAVAVRPKPLAKRAHRTAKEWLVCSLALVAIFCCQELAEGVVSSGHPAGIAALTAARGWIALPLAMVFAALVAIVLKLFDGVDRVLIERCAQRKPRLRAEPMPVRSFSEHTPLALLTLAFGLARRPPPAFLLFG